MKPKLSRISYLILLAGLLFWGFATPALAQDIGELYPGDAAAGAPAFTLLVVGGGYVPGSMVRWNGRPRTTTFVSGEILTAAISATDIASPSAVEITVVNPPPRGGTSNTVEFSFFRPTKADGETRACDGSSSCGSNASKTAALPAQTLTTLHSFDRTDGGTPAAGLVQGTDGNFYGTTSTGGIASPCVKAQQGCGTVFKITPSGTLTTLHKFVDTDGAIPYAGLIQATDGNFYGTTAYGGAKGGGTVFKITASGMLTTLYTFCSQTDCTDGANPRGGLVQATDGNFYGTTISGGAIRGLGTVFQLTPGGALTTLYNFCSQSSCADGRSPIAGLVQANDGNFYGTTAYGGANEFQSGTVFKITAGGSLTTLHSFDYGTDGAFPQAPLVQGTDGSLYGTTLEDTDSHVGTVFKITLSGTLTTLHRFDGTDGNYLPAGLVQATDGNFYGTTLRGGATTFYGTAFKMTPSGTLTTLYTFCSLSGCADGRAPGAGLVQATNGKLYGTTSAGGASNHGTVFSLSVGLDQSAEK